MNMTKRTLIAALCTTVFLSSAGVFLSRSLRPMASAPKPVRTVVLINRHPTATPHRSSPGAAVKPSTDALLRYEDPAFLSRARNQAKVRVAIDRAGLFQFLHSIGAERLDRVADICASTAVATDIAMLRLHRDYPEPSREQVASILADQAAKRDAAVATILTPTEFEQYSSYWQCEPFAQTVSHIADVMRAQGSAISVDDQQRMLVSYTAAITNPPALSTSTDAATDRAFARASGADFAVASAMGQIMSLDDLHAFMNAANQIDFER